MLGRGVCACLGRMMGVGNFTAADLSRPTEGTVAETEHERAIGESPLDKFLRALDQLDAEAAMALMTPGCRLLTVDGRRAEGTEAVRALLTSYLATLHSSSHRVTAEWHQGDAWIAEVEASYELVDRLQLNDLPRAFVARGGPDGLSDVRVYGAHEDPLEHDGETGDRGMRIGGRWMPSL